MCLHGMLLLLAHDRAGPIVLVCQLRLGELFGGNSTLAQIKKHLSLKNLISLHLHFHESTATRNEELRGILIGGETLLFIKFV